MLVAFLFFCLILAGVIWLTQAVRLIDTVLSAGQSLWRLIEFSALVLPRVLAMVVPLSGFAAAIYAINKLYSESELVVMMTAGLGPFAVARPVMIFAGVIALVTLLITNFLAPLGELRLEQSRQQIRTELANALIREGRFLHPTKGLTIFLHRANEHGQMAGLFLHDERDPTQPVTYTAERALLLRDGPLARLIMSKGVALTYSQDDRLLARVQFDEFTYDLSELVQPTTAGPNKSSNMPTLSLLAPTPEVEALPRFNRGTFAAAGPRAVDFRHPCLRAAGAGAGGNADRRLSAARVRAAGGGGGGGGRAADHRRPWPEVRRDGQRGTVAALLYPRHSGPVAGALASLSHRAATPGTGGARMTLQRYITLRFLRAILLVMAGIGGLAGLLTSVENLRIAGEHNATVAEAFVLTAFQLPEILSETFPLILMLAALITFLGLARTSEMVIVRAAGVSALRVLVLPLMVVGLMGLAATMVGNPIVAPPPTGRTG